MTKEESGLPMTRTEYLQTLGGIGDVLSEVMHYEQYEFVVGVVLAGSYGKGTAARDSDVDYWLLTKREGDEGVNDFAKELVAEGKKKSFKFDLTTTGVNVNNVQAMLTMFLEEEVQQTVIYCDYKTRGKIKPIIERLNIRCQWMILV